MEIIASKTAELMTSPEQIDSEISSKKDAHNQNHPSTLWFGAYHSSICSIDLLCSPPSWRTGLLYTFTPSTGSCLNRVNLPLSFLWENSPSRSEKLQENRQSQMGEVESNFVDICWWYTYLEQLNNQFLMDVWFKQPFPHVKIWNHPTETTIYKQMFQVPGVYSIHIIENEWFDFWDILMLKSLRLVPYSWTFFVKCLPNLKKFKLSL